MRPCRARCTASGPAAEPVAGSSGTPRPGANMRAFQPPSARREAERAATVRRGRARSCRARAPPAASAVATRPSRSACRCRRARPAPSSARRPSAASSSPSAANGCHVGTGCSIQPKLIRAPSRSSSTGTIPAPVSSRSTIACSGPPSTKAAPSVGCPAKGSSAAGVKMRMRTSAPSACGGSTKTVSDRFVSRASRCIVSESRSRASVKTASWLPASAVSVKTSTTV